MVIQLQKWGNSLALRIPKAYVQEVNVRQGGDIDLSVVNGKLVLTPVPKSEYSLKTLLNGVTKDNIHSEQSFGCKEGKEVW